MKKKNRNKVQPAEAQPASGKAQSAGFTAPLWVVVALIAVVTVIAYIPLFDAEKQFTNYDDTGYVTAQPLVLDFNVAEMFKTTYAVGLNYHPLTVLSLALSHKMFGLDARAFALTNLFLHVINALLVFFFIRMLVPARPLVAALTGLWFGIHPMHVESVAWIAERKDSLYVLFLLLSMMLYIWHLRKGGYTYLILSFAAFVASCLSKAMAVPLPFVLFLLDYWHDRKWTLASILEKVPFIGFAVWIGSLTVSIQTSLGAVSAYRAITDRVVFACYSFMMYWVKMLVPFDLSAFHPYPGTGAADAPIPTHFYMGPLFVAALVAVPFVLLRNRREAFKSWIFGLGFFALMVALVLQIVSVGMVLMADRYSYAPYIGSLFLLALAAGSLIESKLRPLGLAAVAAFTVMQVYITYDYTKAWKNTETLWEHVISRGSTSTDPKSKIIENIKNGYTPVYVFRATHFLDTKQFDKAYQDLSFLLYSECVNPGPYEQMGLVCGILGKYQTSVDMLTRAIAMHPVTPNIYINRAISFINLRKRDEAFKDFEAAIAAGASGSDYIQANVFVMEYLLNSGKYAECLERARLVKARYPSDSEAYFFEGTALLDLGKAADAVQSLKKSLELNPDQPGAKKNLDVALRRTS